MPENELNKIEVRSEEIQDILGQVPRWIVRWGTVVVLLTVLILLAFSFIFEYPEIIRANIRVTTENPPAAVVARVNGQIEIWKVQDSTKVQSGDHLVVIESSASYSDVLELKYDMEVIHTIITDFEGDEQIIYNNSSNLGDIQSSYAEFINTYQDYYQFLALDSHAKIIQSKEEQVRQYQAHTERLKSQTRILLQDFELEKKQYERIRTLLDSGSIAEAEADKAKQKVLDKELKYETSKTDLSTIDMQISDLRGEIENLGLIRQDLTEQKQSAIRKAFENLVAQVDIWEQDYVLKAPIDGIVSRNKIYHENQNVKEGDIVFTVIPENPGEIIGMISLPVKGSGKVEIGQDVNIKFVNYPYLEYGMVRGTVRTKSLVADDELYTVEVELPDRLITLYDIQIPFDQEMLGAAEIITDDRTLIERIYSPIRSLLSKQKAGRTD